MSFANSVAGPSRLPYLARAVRTAVPSAPAVARRGYASEAEGYEGGGERRARGRRRGNRDDDVDAEASEGAAAGEEPALELGYDKWLYKVGWQYKTPERGAPAKWLGDSVPFPTNPSFRPPPPLSNDLQDILIADVRTGKRTIGQIAQQYNVSKARIEAIRKLKAVEDEFRRQGLPLQTGFQDGMETLLGVRSPVDKRTKAVNIEARRREETMRAEHPATNAEADEEYRSEHNVGFGGAFGNLKEQSLRSGIEKDVWEFQSEATMIQERKDDATARKQAQKAKQDEINAKPQVVEKIPEPPTVIVKPGKNVYRFIDSSKATPAPTKKAH